MSLESTNTMSFAIQQADPQIHLIRLIDAAKQLTPAQTYEECLLLVKTILITHNSNWSLELVRGLKLGEIPMRCKGSLCPYSSTCMYYAEAVTDDNIMAELIGGPCKVEVIDVAQEFVGTVRDLGIDPTHFIDLKEIVTLVRTNVAIKRIWSELNVFGIGMETVDAIGPDGTAYSSRKANDMLKHLALLEKTKSNILTKLEGTRQQRLAAQKASALLESGLLFGSKLQQRERLKGLVNPNPSSFDEASVIDVEVTE